MEFDRYAKGYDLSNRIHFLGRHDEFRARHVGRADPPRLRTVLDFGCGTSANLAALRRLGFAGRYVGVDVSGGMMAEARRKFAAELDRTHHLRIGKGGALPLADGSVDAVFSALVFHLLPPPRRHQVLTEFRRVLAPGGRAYLAEFGPPTSLVGRLTRFYILNIWTRFVADERNAEGLLTGRFPDEIRQVFPRVEVEPFAGALDLITAAAD